MAFIRTKTIKGHKYLYLVEGTRGEDNKVRQKVIKYIGPVKTKCTHTFTGSCKIIDAPANRPSWLPAKVKKPIVRKVGVERADKV